jgi:hypothetical protein
MLRAKFGSDTHADASFGVKLISEREIGFGGHCCGEDAVRRGSPSALGISPFDKEELLPLSLPIPKGGGERSVATEAALAALLVRDDVEDILLRLCAPDMSGRVTTGACTRRWHWGAPVKLGATYHADASKVSRDLALSWVHLHDNERVERAAGMSLDALHARVEAAPHGARVKVASGGDLSREAVLAAISASPLDLLDALEASAAVPDDEWLAVEPIALETIEAMKAGVPTRAIDVTTRKHMRFLEQHAPYHVRRLPNGGVMLATHPYRTLWQLYADALFLLGISPS